MSRLNYKEYQKLIGDRIKQYRVNAGISPVSYTHLTLPTILRV